MAVILFGGLFGPLFLMLGLSQTTAASGSLLLNLEGLATMAIAWLVFRENVERRLLLGAASSRWSSASVVERTSVAPRHRRALHCGGVLGVGR